MSILQTRAYSLLYFITIGWGVATFWIPEHLPLADLPQHAGQITLLKDMLLGQSKWSDLFQVNLLTPYLTSYALALLLSFVVSVSTAFKILLSVGYVAFIYTSIQLRQHFKVDSRLDWLFILPFFGFAYQYGFLSFVLAVPIGLWFILVADRHAQNHSTLNTTTLIAVGLFLLESHGLMFLFSVGLGGLFLVLRIKTIKSLLYGSIPYVVLFTAFSIIFFVNVHINAKLGLSDYTLQPYESTTALFSFLTKTLRELPLRISQAFFYVLAGSKISIYPLVHIPSLLVIFTTPWLLGLRINWQNKISIIFFSVLLMLFIFVPVYTFGTYFVYQRFAILLIPSYVLLFTKTNITQNITPYSINRYQRTQKFTMTLMMMSCWIVLTFNTICGLNFKRESADIDGLISRLEPSQKALSIIYDPISKANNNSLAYVAYPQWYQAEKHGLVYENFAIYAPMPVRFKPGKMYSVFDGSDVNSFDWKKHHGDNYRYFFVRKPESKKTESEIRKKIFKGAPCEPNMLTSKGRWIIYEQLPCK